MFVDVDHEVEEFEEFLRAETGVHHEQAQHAARLAVELHHPLPLLTVGVVLQDPQVVLEVEPQQQLLLHLSRLGLSGGSALPQSFELTPRSPLPPLLQDTLLAIILALDLLLHFVVLLQRTQQPQEELLAAEFEPLLRVEAGVVRPHHLHEGFLGGEGLRVDHVVAGEAGVEAAGDVLLHGVQGDLVVERLDLLDKLLDVAGEGGGQQDGVLNHAEVYLVVQTPLHVYSLRTAPGFGWRWPHRLPELNQMKQLILLKSVKSTRMSANRPTASTHWSPGVRPTNSMELQSEENHLFSIHSTGTSWAFFSFLRSSARFASRFFHILRLMASPWSADSFKSHMLVVLFLMMSRSLTSQALLQSSYFSAGIVLMLSTMIFSFFFPYFGYFGYLGVFSTLPDSWSPQRYSPFCFTLFVANCREYPSPFLESSKALAVLLSSSESSSPSSSSSSTEATISIFRRMSLIALGEVGLLICIPYSWQSSNRQVRVYSRKIMRFISDLMSSWHRISLRASQMCNMTGQSSFFENFLKTLQTLYLMKSHRVMGGEDSFESSSYSFSSAFSSYFESFYSCSPSSLSSCGFFFASLNTANATDISQEKLVQALTMNMTAMMAPIIPPMNENTVDSFWTCRSQMRERASLLIYMPTQAVPGCVMAQGCCVLSDSAMKPMSVTSSLKGQIEQSVLMVKSEKYRRVSVPSSFPKMTQTSSSRQQLLQTGLSGFITVLMKQKVKQKQSLLSANTWSISAWEAHGREGSVALLHGYTWKAICWYFSEEYFPKISYLEPMGGHSHPLISNLSKLCTNYGMDPQCSGVHCTSGMGMVDAIPYSSQQYCDTMSKYLTEELRFCRQISMANMKFLSGSAVMAVQLGSTRLMEFSVQLIVLRLRVSRIMLAKLIMMVMMMPMEIIPPVRVRNSFSFWKRSICEELKKSLIYSRDVSRLRSFIGESSNLSKERLQRDVLFRAKILAKPIQKTPWYFARSLLPFRIQLGIAHGTLLLVGFRNSSFAFEYNRRINLHSILMKLQYQLPTLAQSTLK